MTPETKIDISIIIPAKDEENRLPVFLFNLLSYCQASLYNYEIIIVDDGSRDNTTEVVKQFQPKFNRLHLISLRENRGKGFAVKTGFWEAKGDVVLFMDADGSTPPEAIEENLHFLKEGYDVVIGSRVVQDSRHKVKVRNYRKFIGQVFNFFVHRFLISSILDTQCGFKMFRSGTIRPLFSRLNIDGFGFDLEILYLTTKFGYKVKEVPVNWRHVDDSKTNLVTDSFKMLMNIFQIRSWHLPAINIKTPHMSDEEITHMYLVEKDHWWFQSKNAFVAHLLEKDPVGIKTILDAGCGTGLNLLFLKRFGRCFGCDAVEKALKFCRQNQLDNLVRCDLEQIPFQNKKFDVITLLDVAEHVQNPATVFAQLRQQLNEDGKIIVTVPAFKFLWSQHDEALSHYRRYSKKELKNLLQDAGFEIEKIGYFFCLPFLLAAPVRIIKRIFHQSKEVKSDTVKLPPLLVNRFFKWLLRQEIKLTDVVPLPFGTTLYAQVKNSPRPVNMTLHFQKNAGAVLVEPEKILVQS